MIYTSYFAKAKKLNDEYLVLGITRFPPKNFTNNLECIAPSRELLNKWKNKEVDEAEYEKIYLREINIYIDWFAEYLRLLQEHNKHVVMCCYESSDKFCHRHILARELNKRGFNIKEL